MKKDFEKWLKTLAGQHFFDIEKKRFTNVSSILCGAYGLQLTLSNQCDLLTDLSISSKIHVVDSLETNNNPNLGILNNEGNIVLADGDALPFTNKEFNVVLAPHLVELSSNPQAVLREIYRVTAPEGLVLLTALNPYSLLSLQTKLFRKQYRFSPSVGLTRMKDWLTLLGFDIVAGNLYQYSRLSANAQSRVSRLHESIGDRWLPMTAGAYLLVARKRIFGQTLVGLKSNKKHNKRQLIKPVSLNSSRFITNPQNTEKEN